MYRVLGIVIVVTALGMGSAQGAPGLRMILPADVNAVVGHEISIYFDNIVLARDTKSLVFDVNCSKGRQDEERWRFTPVAGDVGDFALSISVLDAEMKPLAQGSATLHVTAADAGAGKDVSLMIVGDSLTHASVYPEELLNLCKGDNGPNLRLVGTFHPNPNQPPGVVHEGYGGWAWRTFCTQWTDGDGPLAKSQFLRLKDGKPVLDFQAYCDRVNGGKGPDYITVFLGCNDNFGANEQTIEASINDMFRWADMLLAEFKRVRPDTQIGILFPTPPAASQDAFGSNYLCGQTRWQYVRNQHRVVERMTEKWGGKEIDGIFLVPSHINLDTVHNYPVSKEPANARSGETIARQINGVHPSAEGYWQIADSIYYWLKGRVKQALAHPE